jgi:hypothetical protein
MKVLFLNGPRKSGKDTASNHLKAALPGVVQYKMTAPSDLALPAFFGITPERWAYLREEGKTLPSAELFGFSTVEVLISFWEEWVKPKFGPDIAGFLAAQQLRGVPDDALVVVSDSGFRDEVAALALQAGPANCLLLQISRDGKTFDGDSRSYVDLTDLGVPLIEIHNEDGMEADFLARVERATKGWLDGTSKAE